MTHDLLREGGVLLGDDYRSFPAVQYDLDLFCKYFNYKLTFTGDGETWLIKKGLVSPKTRKLGRRRNSIAPSTS